MQQFFSLLSWRLFTAQHVSGVFPLIIKSSMTAVAASGFTFVSWWQPCCVRDRVGQPARPRTQHGYHVKSGQNMLVKKNLNNVRQKYWSAFVGYAYILDFLNPLIKPLLWRAKSSAILRHFDWEIFTDDLNEHSISIFTSSVKLAKTLG
jgi:hypothetical protein